jgi:hypothetical protein
MEKKTRKPKGYINWLKLGKDKDPEFNTIVLLYCNKEKNPDEGAMTGWLKSIESEIGAKVYKFVTGSDSDGNDIVVSQYTHYAIVTPPVE